MKGGRGDLVSGKLEPQVSGVNHLPQEWVSTGGDFASQQTFGNNLGTVLFLLVLARRQVLLTSSE